MNDVFSNDDLFNDHGIIDIWIQGAATPAPAPFSGFWLHRSEFPDSGTSVVVLRPDQNSQPPPQRGAVQHIMWEGKRDGFCASVAQRVLLITWSRDVLPEHRVAAVENPDPSTNQDQSLIPGIG